MVEYDQRQKEMREEDNEMKATTREQEITQILAPWLRAKVENGLLKVWLSENAPEYVKNIYRNCYS